MVPTRRTLESGRARIWQRVAGDLRGAAKGQRIPAPGVRRLRLRHPGRPRENAEDPGTMPDRPGRASRTTRSPFRLRLHSPGAALPGCHATGASETVKTRSLV